MMRDKEDQTEAHMRRVLEAQGFHVERIPTGSTETADYRVSDDSHQYVIEVKRKKDDPGRMAAFEKELVETGEAIRQEPVGRTNVLAKKIHKAAGQLAAIARPGEFRLIWFAGAGDSPDLQIDQFRSTLYGEVLMVVAREGKIETIPCYYYTFSKFFDFPEVDGAIVASETHGGFCLNTFSPRAAELRQTKLFKMFEECDSVIDPAARELDHEALVLDEPVDRHDKSACYMALLRKYHFAPRELLPFEGQVSIARMGFRVWPEREADGK